VCADLADVNELEGLIEGVVANELTGESKTVCESRWFCVRCRAWVGRAGVSNGRPRLSSGGEISHRGKNREVFEGPTPMGAPADGRICVGRVCVGGRKEKGMVVPRAAGGPLSPAPSTKQMLGYHRRATRGGDRKKGMDAAAWMLEDMSDEAFPAIVTREKERLRHPSPRLEPLPVPHAGLTLQT
jgi:hypothetical protein